MQEHTEVPYHSELGPVLSQNQQLGTFPLMPEFFLYLFKDDVMYNIPHHYIHHHAKLRWHHALLVGKSHACIQTSEW